MRIRANAKINLTLDITGKRSDGYHILDSIMQSVTLCDIIDIKSKDTISVSCDTGDIDEQNNICYKAAKAFFAHTDIKGGAQISIKKQIPLSAGMGGGSADAAAVICALDRLYDTHLSKQEINKICLSVGADVPFCAIGGTARVGGIGEIVEPIKNIPECVFVLVKNSDKQSTADMYKKIDAMNMPPYTTQAAVDAINNGDISELCKNITNHFSLVSRDDVLLADMGETNPMALSLSGSGPTVFAVYPDITAAQAAAHLLECKGYSPIIAMPATSGVVFE